MKKATVIVAVLVVAVFFGYHYLFSKDQQPERHLFNIETEHQKDLDNVVVSNALRKIFKEKGQSLSEAVVVEVKNKGLCWQINDKNNKRQYLLRKEKQSIKVSLLDKSKSTVQCEVEMLDIGEETDGIALYKKRRFEDASAKFEKDLNNPRNLAYTAMCYGYLKNYDKADEYWQKAIAKFPESKFAGDAYYYMGLHAKSKDLLGSYRKSLEQAAKYYAVSFSAGKAARQLGDYYLEKGEKIQAWQWYSMAILGIYPKDTAKIKLQLKAKLDSLSKLLFNEVELKFCEYYTVQSGDNLIRIGQRYKIAPTLIQWLNGKKSDRLRLREKLKVIHGPIAIEVSKGSHLLIVYLGNEKFPPYYLRGYEVGLGKNDKTPEETFIIKNKQKKPQWYPPEGGIVQNDDPRNPLGTRWMGFENKPGFNGYGIHGTKDPDSIGKNMSNGCVRMRNSEVEELFKLVPEKAQIKVETKVHIKKY